MVNSEVFDSIAVKNLILPNETTTQRDAKVSPQKGTIIFNTTTSKINFYDGSAWKAVTSA
jgi:hypothetical protein